MCLMPPEGYGRWINGRHVLIIEDLSDNEKREYIKNLFLEDPDKYFEWKAWCIRRNKLPDIFGTRDNPIPIDESKL